MPTKKNGQGKQQPYIPAGNGDRSGEYTNENNPTKQIDNIKKELGYKEELGKYKIGTKLDDSTLVDKVDVNNTEELKLTLNSYLSWLATLSEEHNIIIDKYGNIWHTAGDNASVQPSDKISQEGGINIHNHTEPHSFSKDDLYYMQNNLDTIFYLVDKNNTYRVKFLKKLDMPYNDLYHYGLQEADKINDFSKVEDFYMEYLKDKGYVLYEKYNRNTRM